MMDQPPPIPLDYCGPGNPEPRGPNAPKQFAVGLFGGIAVSALVYLGGMGLMRSDGSIFLLVLYLAPLIGVAKLGVAVSCVLIRPRRALGVGIITSIPVGFMIFFGACKTLASG